MMSLADEFAVLCADAIDDPTEKQNVINSLLETGKEVIQINEQQTKKFAGNMLQIRNDKGQKFVIMSTAAFNSLEEGQLQALNRFGNILHSDLTTIETCGGGSARCMIAEVFLPSVDFSVDKPPELITLPPA
jgi:hypothetical protein